jgi:hypothetical protein
VIRSGAEGQARRAITERTPTVRSEMARIVLCVGGGVAQSIAALDCVLHLGAWTRASRLLLRRFSNCCLPFGADGSEQLTAPLT